MERKCFGLGVFLFYYLQFALLGDPTIDVVPTTDCWLLENIQIHSCFGCGGKQKKGRGKEDTEQGTQNCLQTRIGQKGLGTISAYQKCWPDRASKNAPTLDKFFSGSEDCFNLIFVVTCALSSWLCVMFLSHFSIIHLLWVTLFLC